jgi:hypothetical protein
MKIETLQDNNELIVFPELHVSDEQIDIISKYYFDDSIDNLKDYYMNKIHCETLEIKSENTSKEDQPDFQYIFDLGIKALKEGVTL